MITKIETHQPNFKSYSIIQIPKKVFSQPNNYLAIENSLIGASKKLLSEKNIFKKIINFIKRKPNGVEFSAFLEQPLYANLMQKLDEIGGYSIEWLRLHTGAKIKSPLKEDFHSLIFLTGEDNHKFSFYTLNPISIILKKQEIANTLTKQVKEGRVLDPITITAHLNDEINEDFEDLFLNLKPKIYQANNIDEFEKIIKAIRNNEKQIQQTH